MNIHDVVDANLRVLETDASNYQVYNVGGDHAVTISDFAMIVAEAFGRTDYVPDVCGKYRFGDTRHIRSDVGKLKRLGWQPTRSMKDSVREYRAWLESTDFSSSVMDAAEKEMTSSSVIRSLRASKS